MTTEIFVITAGVIYIALFIAGMAAAGSQGNRSVRRLTNALRLYIAATLVQLAITVARVIDGDMLWTAVSLATLLFAGIAAKITATRLSVERERAARPFGGGW